MADTRIKVIIHERTILSWPHQMILAEFEMVRVLKEAGMPIDGINKLRGVIAGRLTIWRETDKNGEIEHHFEWVGPVRNTVPVTISNTTDEDDEL